MRQGSFVFPLLLIAAGVILLLTNLGYLPRPVWSSLLRLWPVVLIALGLDLLFGRSMVRWAVGVALAALVAIVVLLAVFHPTAAGLWEAVRVPIGGAARAEITVAAPVGEVLVRATAGTDLLVGGKVRARWPDRSTWTARRSEGTEQFSLALARLHPFPAEWWPERSQVALDLAPGIPLALRAMLGAGRASLDLSALDLVGVTVRGGAGKVDVTFPSRGQFAARIVSGTGEVTVRIPSGLGARIRIEEGWGPVDTPPGWGQEDGLVVSPGYQAASHRVDLTVQAGPGRIRILPSGTP